MRLQDKEIHPQRREVALYPSINNLGHRTESAPAPNLSTEQLGLSDTLVKAILKVEGKAKKWKRKKQTRSLLATLQWGSTSV